MSTTNSLTTLVPRHADAIAHQRFDDQVVLIQLARQHMFGLNRSGSYLWELVDGKRSAAELASSLAARYGLPLERARSDVRLFIERLVGEGCLVLVGPKAEGAKASPP